MILLLQPTYEHSFLRWLVDSKMTLTPLSWIEIINCLYFIVTLSIEKIDTENT